MTSITAPVPIAPACEIKNNEEITLLSNYILHRFQKKNFDEAILRLISEIPTLIIAPKRQPLKDLLEGLAGAYVEGYTLSKDEQFRFISLLAMIKSFYEEDLEDPFFIGVFMTHESPGNTEFLDEEDLDKEVAKLFPGETYWSLEPEEGEELENVLHDKYKHFKPSDIIDKVLAIFNL